MQFSSSFFSFKKTARRGEHSLKYDAKAIVAKILSLLRRHSVSDSQMNVRVIGKERQTRHSAGYLAPICKNIYYQFKLQSYKDIIYDAFAIHYFTAQTSTIQS